MGIGSWLGHKASQIGNIVEHPADALHTLTNDIGITNAAPPDISKTPDVQAQRDYRDALLKQYGNLTPGQTQQVTAGPVLTKNLDATQSDQSRALANQNIAGLQGVASGATDTAADALLRQGTDQAARQATGLAATYSAQNPGMALRQGLAASNQAYAQAASTAAAQKASEQATARGQIGSLADAMRGQDLNAASANQGAWNDAQKTNVANNLQAQQLNQNAGLQQQNVNNQFQLGLANAAQNSLAAPVSAVNVNAQNQLANQKSNQEGIGAGLTALGGALKSSDRDVKTDIKPASLADALAKTVRGVTYTYKPGHEDGGEHAGIIAQDLEKALPGVVTRGPDGVRKVDTGHLSLGLAGATAELAKRLRAVEARR